jgi:hypothetical protein
MIKRKPTLDTSEQHKRFIETARALECDEDKEQFEEKLKRIATAKPKPSQQIRTKPVKPARNADK